MIPSPHAPDTTHMTHASSPPIASHDPRIGLIAGQGQLPLLTAQGMRAAGREVCCVALRDQYDPALRDMCDRFAQAGIIQVGRWTRLLRRFGVSEAIMVGGVKKARMYDPAYLIRQIPDFTAARLWFGRLRHDRRDDAILRAVVDTLADRGITLLDSRAYVRDHLASMQPMTRHTLSSVQQADLAFGLNILQQLGRLDIGQSIAVKDCSVIAVEAVEGTDAMIERAGQLCRRGKWMMLKAARVDQDMRADVPTIGVRTIEHLHEAGAAALAVEADRLIMLDRPAVIDTADRLGIAVVGFELPQQRSGQARQSNQ